MASTYEYPRPALTVDAVVFGLDEGDLKALLIQRDLDPFKGKWAFPGGFVRVGESLEDAVRRELEEEAGVSQVFLEQLYTFGDVNRDPRERVVTVAYYGLAKLSDHRLRATTDARDAAWFAVSEARGLAFDHDRILAVALERLKGKVRYQPIGFELLPTQFTLSQLQRLYETILEAPLDKRNFRKKILGMDFLVPTDEVEKDVAHRVARLYRFDRKKYGTVVASLWSMDDEATRKLMVRFYENLWNKTKPLGKLQALRGAQLEMLRERYERGMVRSPKERGGKLRVPPYYWAAFVLSGDWR